MKNDCITLCVYVACMHSQQTIDHHNSSNAYHKNLFSTPADNALHFNKSSLPGYNRSSGFSCLHSIVQVVVRSTWLKFSNKTKHQQIRCLKIWDLLASGDALGSGNWLFRLQFILFFMFWCADPTNHGGILWCYLIPKQCLNGLHYFKYKHCFTNQVAKGISWKGPF